MACSTRFWPIAERANEAGADQADKQCDDRFAQELQPRQVDLQNLQDGACPDKEQ